MVRRVKLDLEARLALLVPAELPAIEERLGRPDLLDLLEPLVLTGNPEPRVSRGQQDRRAMPGPQGRRAPRGLLDPRDRLV